MEVHIDNNDVIRNYEKLIMKRPLQHLVLLETAIIKTRKG